MNNSEFLKMNKQNLLFLVVLALLLVVNLPMV